MNFIPKTTFYRMSALNLMYYLDVMGCVQYRTFAKFSISIKLQTVSILNAIFMTYLDVGQIAFRL